MEVNQHLWSPVHAVGPVLEVSGLERKIKQGGRREAAHRLKVGYPQVRQRVRLWCFSTAAGLLPCYPPPLAMRLN